MMAKLFDAASGVVVQFRQDSFNVVSTSRNSDNFLEVDSHWPWVMKSFCRRIMETQTSLYVSNAAASEEWACAPPVSEGPVRSYLGYPLYWPDGSLFGSFCIIDTKATDYDESLIEMLGQLKLIVESELKHVFDSLKVKALLAEKITSEQLIKKEQAQIELMNNALSLQESINTATLASLIDAVIRIDKKGKILACNHATEVLFGYKTDDLIGENVKLLAELEHAVNHDSYIENYHQTQSAKVIGKCRQVNARRKDGSTFPVQLSVTKIQVGNELQFIGLISDISEKVQYQKLLKQLALYDPLTNCANRNLLKERFDYESSKATREKSSFTMAYLDLNKFKPINDNYGHAVGDAALKEVAARLKKAIRAHDLVARVGGDEFVILFNNQIKESKINKLLNRSLAEHFSFETYQIDLSASIGIANFPEDGSTLETLLDKADSAMYQNKKKT